MNKNYIVYHLHTEQSLLDSCTNYKLYVDKAVELGQTAIAFTEHAVSYNWVDKKMYRDWETDRKSTRLNSSHSAKSRMPSSA